MFWSRPDALWWMDFAVMSDDCMLVVSSKSTVKIERADQWKPLVLWVHIKRAEDKGISQSKGIKSKDTVCSEKLLQISTFCWTTIEDQMAEYGCDKAQGNWAVH